MWQMGLSVPPVSLSYKIVFVCMGGLVEQTELTNYKLTTTHYV